MQFQGNQITPPGNSSFTAEVTSAIVAVSSPRPSQPVENVFVTGLDFRLHDLPWLPYGGSGADPLGIKQDRLAVILVDRPVQRLAAMTEASSVNSSSEWYSNLSVSFILSLSGASRSYSSVVLNRRAETSEIGIASGLPLRRIGKDGPLVDGEIEGRLKLLVEFVALIDMDDVLVGGSKQKSVQIPNSLDATAPNIRAGSSPSPELSRRPTAISPILGGPTRRASSNRELSSKAASIAVLTWAMTAPCPTRWERELGAASLICLLCCSSIMIQGLGENGLRLHVVPTIKFKSRGPHRASSGLVSRRANARPYRPPACRTPGPRSSREREPARTLLPFPLRSRSWPSD